MSFFIKFPVCSHGVSWIPKYDRIQSSFVLYSQKEHTVLMPTFIHQTQIHKTKMKLNYKKKCSGIPFIVFSMSIKTEWHNSLTYVILLGNIRDNICRLDLGIYHYQQYVDISNKVSHLR